MDQRPSTKPPSSSGSGGATGIGGGVVGGGGGILLILLAHNLSADNPWKSWMELIAPAASVGLTGLIIWFRHNIIDSYLRSHRANRAQGLIDQGKARIGRALENPHTSVEHRNRLKKELEQLDISEIKLRKETLEMLVGSRASGE